MWRILYPFRQDGVHFRRQVQIGTYYVDFACLSPSLVIAVDGDSHGGELAQSNDVVRDDYLRGRGFRVLRFGNSDVLRNPAGVYEVIDSMLTEISERGATPTPNPSPQGGGEPVP
jgi:very-short-patch-repair endonuclease